jgi:hypothetical protein
MKFILLFDHYKKKRPLEEVALSFVETKFNFTIKFKTKI